MTDLRNNVATLVRRKGCGNLSGVLKLARKELLVATVAVMALATSTSVTRAQSINVPNGSFESQSGVGQPFGVNIFVDSWQKAPRPDYFGSIETNYGIYWIQTAGVFVDTNPYGNHDGTQAGYILSFPQVTLFQDYNTMDWNDSSPPHDFNATFEVGKSYKMTIGVFAKTMTEGSMLQLSLYYWDALENMVTVGSRTITYGAADFPLGAPWNLIDYEVNVPTVHAGDAWAGQNIGIRIESVFGYGDGNWDFDNVRLTAVPEPTSMTLLTVGFAGLLFGRRQRQQS